MRRLSVRYLHIPLSRHNNPMLRIQFLILHLLMLSGPWVQAQECEPIPANKQKRFVYQGMSVRDSILANGLRIYGRDTDVVYLYDGRDTVRLLVKHDNQVIVPFVRIGNRTDSIDLRRGGAWRRYDFQVRSGNVYASRFTKPDSLVYYNKSGGESEITVRSEDGVLRKRIVPGSVSFEDDVKIWNDKGILVSHKVKDRLSQYDDNGQLKFRQYDTVIHGFARCRETYDPSGVLRSVTYHELHTDSPCHLWRFYSADGTLKDSIRYRESNQSYGTEYTPRPPEFNRIEEPSYAGINYAFDPILADLLCTSRARLDGVYVVRTRVNVDGKATFLGISGLNSSVIEQRIHQLVDSMGKWRPAWFDEKMYSKTVHIFLRVENVR